jgi:hypothetical protein
MPINLFFQRIQDAHPRIGNNAWTGNRHKLSQLARGWYGPKLDAISK